MTAPVDALRIVLLTEDRAEELAEQLLTMSHDSAWDDWGREHLMSPRDQKWERSLLATRGGRPVAWAIVSRTDQGAHVHHLVVAGDERSSGLGSAMMREVFRRTNPGVLTSKVHPDNEAAARWHLRLGFDEQPPSPSGYRVFSRITSDDEESAT